MERDEKILSKGIKVFRIKNEDITEVDRITETLNAVISRRLEELSKI